jgi:tetratricopeptide (TPR) repeat protein
MAADLEEKDRVAEALAAYREAVRLDPEDGASRARLAKAALADGRLDEARTYLTREVAGEDAELLESLVTMNLRGGDVEGALAIAGELLERDPPIPDIAERLVESSLELAGSEPAGAFACLDLIVDRQIAASEWEGAVAMLHEFVARAPTQIPALLKLVEICVDGGLESTMYEAQAQLADAYLAANKGTEACVIAEDLVAREPWESAHLDRFRRALIMQGTPNPDAIIAERLSGESPFTATDPFADPAPPEPEPEPEPEPPGEAESVAREMPRPRAAQDEAGRDPAFQVTLDGIDLQAILGGSSPEAATPESTTVPRAAAGAPPAGAKTEQRAKDKPEAPPEPTPPLDTVFEKMRRETGRATAEGGAQDLALAETYVEMGMIDEAVQALGKAVRSPRHRFLAARRLARVHKQRGDTTAAIEWLERATQAPAPSAEEGHAVLYELGLTLEAEGEPARALAVFLELQAEAGDYRDLTVRIERLARVQTGG